MSALPRLMAPGLLTAVLATALAGCARDLPPDPARIEALAMAAAQRGDSAAESQLRRLADGGSVVAERELGILYRSRPGQRAEAI